MRPIVVRTGGSRRTIERNEDGHPGGQRPAVLPPLEPRLGAGGRGKAAAPAGKDVGDPAETREHAPPIRGFAATGLAQGVPGGEVREGDLGGEDQDHLGLTDL